MSGIGDTENLTGQGENEVNHNENKAVTDAVVISDESDAEHDDNPVRECNKSPQLSVDRNQEEECKNETNSSKENQATGEIFTPRSFQIIGLTGRNRKVPGRSLTSLRNV
ncbi:unnamed protein product [Arabis nemorensis]|uniref:Uncharacterized protein n=1 Tax=Arabis nemorensis TaxID=586526 RepID=A0A565BED4_9BRAS|nr:unnamed protein product [Arabis nemorensis]